MLIGICRSTTKIKKNNKNVKQAIFVGKSSFENYIHLKFDVY